MGAIRTIKVLMDKFIIVDKLGGREMIQSRTKGRISTENIRMWGVRGRIPGDGMRALMSLADRMGVAYRAKDFYPRPKRK